MLGSYAHSGKLYEGYSKSSKTNSKKYFIYEIYKIIFLQSFQPIHNTSVSDRLQKCYELDIHSLTFNSSALTSTHICLRLLPLIYSIHSSIVCKMAKC